MVKLYCSECENRVADPVTIFGVDGKKTLTCPSCGKNLSAQMRSGRWKIILGIILIIIQLIGLPYSDGPNLEPGRAWWIIGGNAFAILGYYCFAIIGVLFLLSARFSRHGRTKGSDLFLGLAIGVVFIMTLSTIGFVRWAKRDVETSAPPASTYESGKNRGGAVAEPDSEESEGSRIRLRKLTEEEQAARDAMPTMTTDEYYEFIEERTQNAASSTGRPSLDAASPDSEVYLLIDITSASKTNHNTKFYHSFDKCDILEGANHAITTLRAAESSDYMPCPHCWSDYPSMSEKNEKIRARIIENRKAIEREDPGYSERLLNEIFNEH